MREFIRSTNGFSYTFEQELAAGAEVIVKMPAITPNKRGVNDIGWYSPGNVTLYGTLSSKPEETTMWQEILDRDEVNKTVSALKVKNNGSAATTIIIRVILN